MRREDVIRIEGRSPSVLRLIKVGARTERLSPLDATVDLLDSLDEE